MDSHIGDVDKFREEYKKRYKAKHGVEGSLPDENTPKEQPPPADAKPQDMEVIIDVIFNRIEDRAGCYADVNSFFLKNSKPRFLGELEQVSVDGEKAAGRAKMNFKSTLSQNGKLISVNEKRLDTPFEFRKIDGLWLIDGP